MNWCSLSDKQRTLAIVPVRCGSLRGTAFLVGGGRLLTARHVVEEFYNGNKPVVASFKGMDYTFEPEKVGTTQQAIDVVVLKPVPKDAAFAVTQLALNDYLKLMPIPFKHSEGMKLSVIGYPTELGGGSCQIETIVIPHSYVEKANQKYDVVTVRAGAFKLNNYGGFSGSPVLTKAGYVVGVVSTETYGKLTYCSVERMAARLKKLGVTDVDTSWEVYEDSNLSLQHCEKQVEDAIKKAAGRYHGELHTVNAQLEERIALFTDYSKKEKTEKKLSFIASKAADDIADAINAGVAPYSLPTGIDMVYRYNTYEKVPEYIEGLRSVVKDKTIFSGSLRRLGMSAKQLTEKLDKTNKQLLCLHGKAGMGKTHISCHVADQLVKARKNNVYLLFGSQFDSATDAWEKMLALLQLTEDDVKKMDERAAQHKHYAIFIIDALNEGAGDLYWKQQLNLLASKIKEYAHLKLIFTIRDPFMEEITNDLDPTRLESIELNGFTSYSAGKATDKYFDKFEIDAKYKEKYKRQFKHPLFLIAFCNSYWLLSKDERDNLNLRLLYKTYLTARNAAVSRLAEEDEKRNVTLACMRQLAWYSVEQCLSGLIPRDKARRIADKICPMRTWRNNLLHALLYENLLMETLSDQIEGDLVMFEFENIADVMKAESLLMSKLTEQQIIDLLLRTDDELTKKRLGKAKFDNMVRALIAVWDRKTDVTAISEFTSGRFGYQLVKSQEEYQDERNYGLIKNWLKKNCEQYAPREMLHHLDDRKSTIFETLHPYLDSLEMNERDEVWTIQVNRFMESNGAWHYLERLSHSNEFRNRFIVFTVWLLTTSDPDSRMFLIRLLYRRLVERCEDIPSLMGMFAHCDDRYLLQGLYCAIYGVTLRIRDGKLLAEIAKLVYERYYEHEEDVPVDIVLRQWTLKIMERAAYIEMPANYYHRIRLPFKSQDPRVRMLKKDFDENYFGEEKGAKLLYYSMSSGSDFHRYTIGSNSFAESHDFFYEDEDGDIKPLSLYDIPKMMAPLIKNDYGYNAALARYDGSRYSTDRHHNKTERIGKKYQWLALDATYARLTDHYLVRDYRSDHWGMKMVREELTNEAWPWMTRRYDRFDPTLPSNSEVDRYAAKLHLLPEKDDVPSANNIEGFAAWLQAEETNPQVRMQWVDNEGQQWVRIYGYESGEQDHDKEERRTMLLYNTSFVKKNDSKAMQEWAENQDFSGGWMASRSDCIDFLWNEIPWSDSYKRLGRDLWEAGDQWHPYPCKVLVAYDEQLQEENYGFLNKEERYSFSASMPCGEMLREMKLYTAERGIIRRVADDVIVGINLSIINEKTGLVVRKDILCEYLKKKKYNLYCFILGNKEVRLGSMRVADSRDLSGCMMMNEKGDWKTVQKLRVVEQNR